MSKQIKFRAWIEKCKSMLEGVTVYQTMIGLSDEHFEEDLNPEFEFDGEDVFAKGEDYEKVLSLMVGEEWIFFDDGYVLEQFTGLKDKNEKEFYIGDIGEFDNGDRFVLKLEWFLEISADWIGEPECEDQTRDLYRIENAKIIGDIHRNPELLEVNG